MSSIESNFFDNFFGGCVAFAAICAFFDWCIGEKRKTQIKDFVLQQSVKIHDLGIRQISHICYVILSKPLIIIFGPRPLSGRSMLPYGMFWSPIALFMLVQLSKGSLTFASNELYFAILGCALTLWAPLSASLWFIYSVQEPHGKKLPLILLERLFVAVILSIFAIFVSFMLMYYANDIATFFSLNVAPLKINQPTHTEHTSFGQALGEGIAEGMGQLIFMVLIIFGIALFIGTTVLLPITTTLALLLTYGCLVLIARVLKKPVEVCLQRLFEAPQGVITQIGIGVSALGKIGQTVLKYFGYA